MPAVPVKGLVTGQRRNHKETIARHMSAKSLDSLYAFRITFQASDMLQFWLLVKIQSFV